MKPDVQNFFCNDTDRRLLKLMGDFLPEKIFDAHAHIYHLDHMPENGSIYNRTGTADAARFLEEQKRIYGSRQTAALFLPFPAVTFRDRAVRDQVNAWIAAEAVKHPFCAAEAYVMPGDTVEDIETMLRPGVVGFKCYRMTSVSNDGDGMEASIQDFLPESAWIVADRHGLAITLHIFKYASMAHPENRAYILEMAKKYPNAKLILAHCGRGFAGYSIIAHAREFRGIDNIYYDMAAICEPAPMFEVIRQAGADHMLWGTDYPLSMLRGKPFSCGDWQFWPNQEDVPQMDCGLTTVESLFAFWQASLMLELTRSQVEDIFWNNAMKLFGLG